MTRTATRRERTRNRRGFTAVEVLSAMTLLAIGAAGVIGMQRVTIQGTEDARRLDIGNNLANEWCSRLQRDTAQWTTPNAGALDTININLTQYIKDVTICAGGFCNPPTVLAMTGSFDMFGRDVAVASANTVYCAQYHLQWIASPGIAAPFNPAALMLAEVRVFWSRLERNSIGEAGGCAAATPDAANASELYHFVYATTAIRENAFRE